MKIFVSAKAGAKNPEIKRVDAAHFRVAVKEPARESKANDAVRKALVRYFGVPASRIELLSGASSKRKIFEIV